ncbi:hypothetical protein BESB_068980 [Besnoitia besnoiti]|uniref:Uncharacterized protein n=1 Tax=Besnoitia besnoiti TaxID=94643 RepID=A0A2A9MA50_BESBE|nr:hypothetical protein BESB_068980 [Besnoitia besnoiti]PFH34865.1 hypothetical protein BESB_068980 [Besnoitia besnoiti]
MSFEELMRRKREAQMAERMKQQQTLTAAASSRVSHPGPGVSAAASAAEGLARAARQPQGGWGRAAVATRRRTRRTCTRAAGRRRATRSSEGAESVPPRAAASRTRRGRPQDCCSADSRRGWSAAPAPREGEAARVCAKAERSWCKEPRQASCAGAAREGSCRAAAAACRLFVLRHAAAQELRCRRAPSRRGSGTAGAAAWRGGKAAPPPPVPAQAQLSAAASSSAAAVAQPRGLAKPASAAGAAKRPPAGQPSVQPAAGASLSVQAKSGSVARGGAQAKATAASALAGKAGQKVGVSPAARAQAAEGSPAQAVASKKATALAKPSGVAAASTAPGAAAAPAGASDAGDAKAISCALKNGDLGAYCRQLAAEVAAFHPLGSDAWPASLATASLGAEAFASLAEKLDVMSAHSDREMRERLLDIERTVAAVSTASSSAAAASSASGGAGAGAEGLCVRGVLEEILGPFLACALECAAPLDAAAARDAVIPFASMTFDELRDGVGAALGRTLTDVLGAPAEAAKGLGDPRQLSQALARLALWSDAMETRISSWANEFSKSTGKRPFAHPAAGAQGATAQLPKKLKATTSSVPATSE